MYRRTILSLFFCLTGCGSLTIWDAPKIRGAVVDITGMPIEGVQISDVSQIRKTSKIVTKTDVNGNFELVPGSEKIHPIAPGCYGARHGYFLFEKSLYEAATVPYNVICGGGDMPAMSDAKIVLKQKQRSE